MASSDDLKHNHKPNFGRFVEGCPKCEAKGRPEPRTKKAKASPPLQDSAAALNMSPEMLQQFMAAIVKGQTEALKQFAVELRRGTAEEEEKRVSDAARRAERKRLRIIEIQVDEERKKAEKNGCTHMNERGRSVIYKGQAHTDGFYHPFCHRCGLDAPLIPVSMSDFI